MKLKTLRKFMSRVLKIKLNNNRIKLFHNMGFPEYCFEKIKNPLQILE